MPFPRSSTIHTFSVSVILASAPATNALAQDFHDEPGLGAIILPNMPQSPNVGDPSGGAGGKTDEKPEFPPFDTVSKGLDKVISTADGSQSLYTLWASRKDGRLIAELPKNFEEQLIMIAPTVAGGDEEAGVMGGTIYANWKRIDKALALIEPNYLYRSDGDNQSKSSIKQLYTDRVILDVPIIALGPSGQPVIDLKALFADQFIKFFGPGATDWGPMVMQANPRLATLQSAKAFPRNIEVTYQMPGPGGRLVSMHYSLSELPENKSYKPRDADSRVGFFNVYYRDLGRPGNDQPFTRYICRWQLEKADPSLSKSPPRQPIVWYIESTTPVRYRRFVREGILSWNKAFETCGIIDAVEVYQQDAETGAHMDKDPEDARYNFFRWNTSDQGYAIGPSRVDPRTGQIVDADVVWHAGLTNAIMSMLENLSAEVAVSGFTAETMEWLKTRPQWDPRVRLAAPEQRERMLAEHRHAAHHVEDVVAPTSWKSLNGAHCKIGRYIAMDVGLVDAALAAGLLGLDDNTDEAGDDAADKLDGLPEEFLGGMIRYVSAHEVGHCMGLQHNFSASTIRSLKDINSASFEDGQPIVGSVMEYQGVNINYNLGEEQGPFATPGVGPYDMWAIAFGYGPDADRDKVLARVSEADLIFHSDMTMSGPDPRAMVWDVGSDPLEFAASRMALVKDLRAKIATDLVKDGQSWRKARQRFNSLLGTQIQALVIASRWVGGSYFNRDFKNDPGNRNPIENIPADTQRQALSFVIDNSFTDSALGLSPELLHKLGTEYYPDLPGFMGSQGDPSYTAHDAMAGVQATAMTMIMNPTTLRRLYDNEFRSNGSDAGGADNALTLAEVVDTVSDAVWSELAKAPTGNATAAKPMISSFRRNLQREHVERLIDLSLSESAASSPAWRTIANLSTLKLREINDQITRTLAAKDKLDEYTLAHLSDAQTRITKALEAQYVYGN
jgi:hypothetical protein